MDSTWEPRRDAALATVITLVAHAFLIWGLSRAMRPIVLPQPVDEALQVVWLPRHKAPVAPEEQANHRVTPDQSDHSTRMRRAPASAAHASTTVVPEQPQAAAESVRPMSAVYLMQARNQVEAATVQAADPLADRGAALPGAGAGRFRMKPPPTGVGGVIASVGKLFGAEDAGAPCRENRRNIGELAAAGDSAALQQQLDFEKRLCRP